MAGEARDYKKWVLDDIRAYRGLAKPAKAGLLERILVRTLPPEKLHPNPLDEFSNPDIGPNYEIIQNYERMYRLPPNDFDKTFSQRLTVEKMSTGGYVLLDGHHRWFAARRVGVSRLNVEIMNVTPVEKLISAMKESDRHMCVSFDLDEVLLSDGKKTKADERVSGFIRGLLGVQFRLNSPDLIQELHQLGFDVWAYTGVFRSERRLNLALKLHHIQIKGIVNGFRNTQTRNELRKAFTENYQYSVHIDNAGAICVNTQTGEYETLDFAHTNKSWAAEALAAVKKMKCCVSAEEGNPHA